MTNVAPQCPISHNGPLQGSRQPSGITIDAMPPVHNLREVINAINRLNTVIQHVTRGAPQINNIGQPYEPPGPPPGYGRYTWKEIYRTYTDEEVVNPDDQDQKIKIKVLSSVYFMELTTGHQLAYGGP